MVLLAAPCFHKQTMRRLVFVKVWVHAYHLDDLPRQAMLDQSMQVRLRILIRSSMLVSTLLPHRRIPMTRDSSTMYDHHRTRIHPELRPLWLMRVLLSGL